MKCKACDVRIQPEIRTDHPEYDGILWEDLCWSCLDKAGEAKARAKFEAEEGVPPDLTPVPYSPKYATSMSDIKDLLEEWGVGGDNVCGGD